MEHTDVDSSNVRSYGYDAATQVLEVRYRNGGHYAYHGVPQHEADAFSTAPSRGTYLYQHIKGRYKHERIGDV